MLIPKQPQNRQHDEPVLADVSDKFRYFPEGVPALKVRLGGGGELRPRRRTLLRRVLGKEIRRRIILLPGTPARGILALKILRLRSLRSRVLPAVRILALRVFRRAALPANLRLGTAGGEKPCP